MLSKSMSLYIIYLTHDGPPTLTKGVRVLSAASEMPRNYEPYLGDRAAPRLAPPEVSFKPGGHCDHDGI